MIHLDLPAGDSLTVKVEGSCHLMGNKEEDRKRAGRKRQKDREEENKGSEREDKRWTRHREKERKQKVSHESHVM